MVLNNEKNDISFWDKNTFRKIYTASEKGNLEGNTINNSEIDPLMESSIHQFCITWSNIRVGRFKFTQI